MLKEFNALKALIQTGKLEEVKAMILKNPELLSFIDEQGDTVFKRASIYCHVDANDKASDLLADAGSEQVLTADNRKDVSVDLLHFIIQELPDVNGTYNGQSLLMQAIIYDHVATVRELLSTPKIKVNEQNLAGETALILASRLGAIESVLLLLQKNSPKVNPSTMEGEAALIEAAKMGHIDIVDALIKYGVNVNAQDTQGETALRIAVKNGDVAIAKRLLKTRASLQIINSDQQTLGMIAILNDNEEVFRLLIDAGEKITSELKLEIDRRYAFNELHFAVWTNDLMAVHKYVESGLDLNVKDINERTAVDLAAKYNRVEILGELLHGGAVYSVKDKNIQENFASYSTVIQKMLSKGPAFLQAFNPHRHVKIWFNKNPDIFMNEENKLRLIKMRVDCPLDEINLIYDSRLLSGGCNRILLLDTEANIPETIDRGTICLQEISEQPDQLRIFWFNGEENIEKILDKTKFSPNFVENIMVPSRSSQDLKLCAELTSMSGCILPGSAYDQLLLFCAKHNIIAVNVGDLISASNKQEQDLLALHEDEIYHLDAGGNLAAASDVVRWLRPGQLGSYSDFDVIVKTKHLPDLIFVPTPILLPISNKRVASGKHWQDKQELTVNNDIIGIADIKSAQIAKVQRSIINANKPKTMEEVPEKSSALPINASADMDPVFSLAPVQASMSEDFLATLSDQEKKELAGREMERIAEKKLTPRQFRGEVSALTAKWLKLLPMDAESIQKGEAECHFNSVIASTGPQNIINLCHAPSFSSIDEVFQPVDYTTSADDSVKVAETNASAAHFLMLDHLTNEEAENLSEIIYHATWITISGYLRFDTDEGIKKLYYIDCAARACVEVKIASSWLDTFDKEFHDLYVKVENTQRPQILSAEAIQLIRSYIQQAEKCSLTDNPDVLEFIQARKLLTQAPSINNDMLDLCKSTMDNAVCSMEDDPLDADKEVFFDHEYLELMSLGSYPLLEEAFQSPSAAALRAKHLGDIVNNHDRGSDLSWTKTGEGKIVNREAKFHDYARNIQNFWRKAKKSPVLIVKSDCVVLEPSTLKL